MLQRERRERERESFKCILSLVPYLPKNVFHMLLTSLFLVVVFAILLTRNLTRNAWWVSIPFHPFPESFKLGLRFFCCFFFFWGGVSFTKIWLTRKRGGGKKTSDEEANEWFSGTHCKFAANADNERCWIGLGNAG